MNFKDIEKRASNFRGASVDVIDKNEVNKNIIEVLNICISNNIKLNINEKEFIKIIEIYYNVYGRYDVNFFRDISSLNYDKLDFVKIIDNICK